MNNRLYIYIDENVWYLLNVIKTNLKIIMCIKLNSKDSLEDKDRGVLLSVTILFSPER